MALQEYIVISDVTNKMFGVRFSDPTKQLYIDRANNELEDLAIRKGVQPEDIVTPIHYKLKEYAIQYSLSIFAQDNIGFNNEDVVGEDKYDSLFKRSRYLMQDIVNGITEVMFTGEEETLQNRAVLSQRLIRG